MPTRAYLLAQANIAKMKGPLDSPVMEGFARQLAAINAAADDSPGFVWRLQTDAGDSTDIRAYEDPLILLNMSVWTSLEELHTYVYRSAHARPFRDRGLWFEPIENSLVLWWMPAAQRPNVDDARAKFRLLQEMGPSPEAFTFSETFPPPQTQPE